MKLTQAVAAIEDYSAGRTKAISQDEAECIRVMLKAFKKLVATNIYSIDSLTVGKVLAYDIRRALQSIA